MAAVRRSSFSKRRTSSFRVPTESDRLEKRAPTAGTTNVESREKRDSLPDLRGRKKSSTKPSVSKLFWFIGRTFSVSPAVPLAEKIFENYVSVVGYPPVDLDLYVYGCVMVASKFVLENEWIGPADYVGVSTDSLLFSPVEVFEKHIRLIDRLGSIETEILSSLGWRIPCVL